ncbi:MAG: S1 RNA-binding domain-containing protein [Anaerolineae bacterium]|nr:S1 RNA-binding domain-containing protein [Anaerolineae bacterium]
MNGRYIPPYSPPCERYWQVILEEGPMSCGCVAEFWEWVEAPIVAEEIWEEARNLQKCRKIMQLAIDGFNRGGLVSHWEGVECFIPASHLIAYPFPADPTAREVQFQEYLGQVMRLCIIEVEPARNRILLSERQVAECEFERPQWPDWLCPGRICTGRITSVRPFGAFVDIGPLEGMVHISEISWGRVRHPEDFLEPGQNVEVLILSIDPEHQRVGLSLKRIQPNPWDSVYDRLQCGDHITGTIVSVERFGVFVELVDGLEGLLHISEFNGADYVPNLDRAYHVGQEISVLVLDIVPEDHRIALGLPNEDCTYASA